MARDSRVEHPSSRSYNGELSSSMSHVVLAAQSSHVTLHCRIVIESRDVERPAHMVSYVSTSLLSLACKVCDLRRGGELVTPILAVEQYVAVYIHSAYKTKEVSGSISMKIENDERL